MKNQGMSDSEISRQLQNQGISPQQINDSLNQLKVKSAVSQSEQPQGQPMQGMEQSIMQHQSGQEMEPFPEQNYPYPQEQGTQYPQGAEQQYPEGQAEYYPEAPQAYSGEEYYYPQQPTLDTDTIAEIAGQVVSEQFAEFKKQTGDLASFKNTMQEKIADLSDRLKRIENSIDKIQQAVISKIGEFGESTAAVHKDLENLHNTTSKLMNPLIDNYRELKKISGK